MKKLGILLTGLLLAFGLTSCGDSQQVVEPMSKAEIKESEKVLNEKLKGKSNEEITRMIIDAQEEDNFGEESLNNEGLKFKNYSSIDMNLSMTEPSMGLKQTIKMDADLAMEFIVNAKKGAYASVDLEANMLQSVSYQGQNMSQKSEIDLGLAAEYVKNDNLYINANISDGSDSEQTKGYMPAVEFDEMIGWDFDDSCATLKDLLQDVSTDGLPIESFIGNLDTAEYIKFKVVDGYLEVRYLPNLKDLVDELNASLSAEDGSLLIQEVTESDISLDLIMRLDKNFMFSSLVFNLSINIPNLGTISIKTNTGLSFGNFNYKGLSEKESYTEYVSLEEILGEL